MEKCIKCKDDVTGGSKRVSEGVSYSFCKICTDVLDSFPSHVDIIRTYLSPKAMKSQVMRNIFDARRRRAMGAKWDEMISDEGREVASEKS